MAREPTYGPTATHPPHWGSTRTEPDLQRHPYAMKLKKEFSFGPSQDRPLLLTCERHACYVYRLQIKSCIKLEPND